MRKSTLILLALIIVLGGWWLLTKTSADSKTETLKEEMNFKVEDAGDIHKILIAHRSKKPVRLTKKGKDWYLEDGVLANPYVVEGIVDVLTNARIRYIPSQEEVEKLMPLMATKGIKVEAYDKSDNVLISYYVGAVTQTEKGTHFYKEGGEKSYAMEMPYGNVNIRQRFDIKYDDWKDRVIYRDKIEDISSVKVEFPRSPMQSFVVKKERGGFNVEPLFDTQDTNRKKLKKDVFEKYLIGYKGVNFVEYTNDRVGKDSVILSEPYMISELVNNDNDTFSLKLWPKTRRISTPHQAHEVDNPLNEYYGLDHKGDFGTVQHIVVRGTIAGYDDFFE